MTILLREAERCHRRLVEALEERVRTEKELAARKSEYEKDPSIEIDLKVKALSQQLGEQYSIVTARSAQWQEAAANRAAERQLEKELTHEAERQKEREQQRAPGKGIDDLEL